jgi:tetratricopeptide (TPR) repeat protein
MAEKATKTIFVGREKEIATIKNILKDNPKANILISGFTGMGKTELCMQVKKLLSQDEFIHCGSYRVESKLEDPVNPFLTALLEVFQSVTTKEKEKSKLKWFKDVLAKKVWEKRKDIGGAIAKDAVGTILKILYEKLELGETTSELAEILKDASSEWATKSTLEKLLIENKEAVITTYLRLLREISEQSPDGHKFVLIFNQVENTSEVFREFLKSIARNLPEKFYLVFALNDEIPAGVQFLSEHKADFMFFKTQPVELKGLSNFEIRQLIEEMKGVYKTPDVVERARRLSDGRPLMIIQWINSKDFDLSIIDEEKFRLYGYYEDNLSSVGIKAKKLATLLSLLPFPLKGGLSDYAGIMGLRNFECREQLHELESKNIFRSYDDLCWFSHELIKEYVFDNTPDAIKKDFALQIISYLKKKYKKQIESLKPTSPKSVYAKLLPFTDDYQTSFDKNYDLGMYHYSISSYNTAKEYFESAFQSATKLKDLQKQGNILNNIAAIYDSWGKYDQAIEYYQKSLKITEEIGDRQGEGAILNNIGETFRARGKYDQAIEYYQKSLKIRVKIGDRQGEGVTLSNMGSVYYAWGKYDQAIKYSQKSLKIREEIGDRQGEGVTLNNIGEIYRVRGKYDQAMEYYQKSLKITEEVGDRKQEGTTLNNIGLIYKVWSKYDQAIEYYQKSLKIREEIGDRQGEGVTLNNIGMVYYAWGKYDQAIRYFQKSLNITEEIGDRQQEGVSLNNIGLIYNAWGKYDQAIEYYQKSLKILEEIGAVEAKTVRENLRLIQEEMRKRKK